MPNRSQCSFGVWPDIVGLSREGSDVHESADRVTIVIPHYGSLDYTLSCLAAIGESTPEPHHVVIVDNGTGDVLPGHVVRNETNQGFARACNQGASEADTPVVVFLNNDAEPTAGWLRPLVEAVSEEGVGAASSRLVFPDGSLQFGQIEFRRLPRGRIDPRVVRHERPRERVRAVIAASMAVRREAFDAVGGFDEGYWNGFEDVDLCLRLGEIGWDVVYEPASVVRHIQWGGGEERWNRQKKNAARFSERWKGMPVDSKMTWLRFGRNFLKARLRS